MPYLLVCCRAKESDSESASFWVIGCVGGVGAVPFAALILLHTSAELMLLVHLVIHWFQDRFLTWLHSFFKYFCMSFVLAPDWPAIYVVSMPLVWYCKCALQS